MSYSSRNQASPSQIAGGLIALVVLGFCIWFWCNSGIFGKMQIIILHNWFFWIMVFGGALYAAFRRYKNPENFTWGEVPIQIGVSTLSLWVLSTFFVYQTSDLKNQEVWSGYVTASKYFEQHDSETCTKSCDSKGNNCTKTCTCTTYPESWSIYTNNEESIGAGPSHYHNLRTLFGNENTAGSQGDSCAGHPGTIWITQFDGSSERLVPSAKEHLFVDYLQASKSIRKESGGNTKGFEPLLKPYPRVHSGLFGPLELDRVINAGLTIPAEKAGDFEKWSAGLDRNLDLALTTLAKKKEVNLLVYLADTKDRKFFQALEESWVFGKKNDVVVIIGTEFPKIDWVEIMLRGDDNEELKVALRNKVRDLININEGGTLAKTIVDQISLPHEQGGYKRTRMRDMEYLAADVEVSTGAMFIILLIWGFLTWLTSWALENNEIKEWTAQRFERFGRW
jgi:hypothetical protein